MSVVLDAPFSQPTDARNPPCFTKWVSTYGMPSQLSIYNRRIWRTGYGTYRANRPFGVSIHSRGTGWNPRRGF